jgi:hypothetical protein
MRPFSTFFLFGWHSRRFVSIRSASDLIHRRCCNLSAILNVGLGLPCKQDSETCHLMDHMVARASIKEQDMAAAAAAATVTANHSTDTTREGLEARLTVVEAVITIHMAQHKERNRSK